ncbi:MAG: hypothetical protein JSV56_08205 [Methanomassiliicoccales archaeon]|nr:MAG: hypothetical protein JSV56_08205 [Methanomassiliicoccales archaeon]
MRRGFDYVNRYVMTKNKVLRVGYIGLFLVFALLISSCAKPIRMNDIQAIEPGIEYDKFKSLVQRKPTSSFGIQHKGLSYSVEIYPMQTGTRTQASYVPTQYGGHWVYHSVPVSEDYFFIFHNDRLIFWGFLNECHKADDELVRQLALLISEQYE